MSNSFHTLAIALSFVAAPFLFPGSQGALADDYTVSAPSTDTNGGHVIDGFDALTVTRDGSIVTGNGFQHAIHSTGGGNTIVMDGSITTTGGDAVGIGNDASDNSILINNAIIKTEGAFSNGIMNSDSQYVLVTNAGSIGTAGELSVGIGNIFSTGSLITNTGSIETAGELAGGIEDTFSTGSMITNSGTILTRGAFASAIESVGASVINSGTITTEGAGSHGILIGVTPNVSIANSGSIRTAGTDSIGFVIDGASEATLFNRGLIISEMSDAIRVDSTETTLNLSSAGFIGGRINLNAATTVNLITQASHSVLWDLSTGSMLGGDPDSIKGDVPWFYDASTKQFATFDPSALVGSLDALGDMASLLSKVTRGGLDTGGFWASGFGGVLLHEGDSISTLERKIDQFGFALGYSAQTDGLEWGVSGGYLMSDLDVESPWITSQKVEGHGLFAGVNGEKSFGAFTIDLAVAGGRVTHDSERFVNDNLALTNGLTLGQSWADARYDGWYVAPEVGVSATIGEWNGWSLTPAARLRHASQWLDGYKETGSNANAVVGERSLGLLEARIELSARKTFDLGSVATSLGYQIRRSTGDHTATVTLLDITNSVGLGDTDSAAVYAGMGINLDITPGMRVYLDVTGYFGNDMTGGQASAKFAASF